MTLTIEVDDEKALELLKQLEALNVLKLRSSVKEGIAESGLVEKQDLYGPQQQAELMALNGSLNMSPERLKEFLDFTAEGRGH